MSLYSAAVLALNPIAYWRLGEAAGTTAVAQVGPNAVYAGSPLPTLGVAGPLIGDPDTAISLNGTTSFVDIVGGTAPSTGDVFTLMCWVKRGVINAAHGLYAQSNQGAVMHVSAGNLFSLTRRSVVTIAATTAPQFTDGAWHFAAISKNGAALPIFYVDGVSVAAAFSGGDSTIPSQTNESFIGCIDSGTDLLQGTIDEPAVFNKVLTPTQILNLYTIGTVLPVGGGHAKRPRVTVTPNDDDQALAMLLDAEDADVLMALARYSTVLRRLI